MDRPPPRDLSDTPFSERRLFVWTLGITFLIAVVTLCYLAVVGEEIPRQLQSLASWLGGAVTLGAAGDRRRPPQ